ncbi:hypothetical protein SAMN05444380_11574 [Thermophagus xiamenensis]|uniref:Uncharacterized protein n=1 Tax=Thermophagus xiamenensis TaxID=385682 RepID=A0A1I2CAI7_9BACT|nr:hypothetical protein SAMN05444380_11574 [Thermophagus xiamenensis]
MLDVFMSFNRTIVELKCVIEEISGFSTNCFNRTIVELKFLSIQLEYGRGKGLQSNHSGIEILHFRLQFSPFQCFNRTIVELKLTSINGAPSSLEGFNRTIVELKY